MNWTETIKQEMEDAYHATEGLLAKVEDSDLGWKPSDGSNWMTVGQLLKHIPEACGFCCRGFVTGDWGMPEGTDTKDLSPEQMMPPADKMPSVESVAHARQLLEEDKRVAFGMLAEAGEERLASDPTPAPWDPRPLSLGLRMLQMVGHLTHHKAQLYYYLKSQGKPVATGDLYGMQM